MLFILNSLLKFGLLILKFEDVKFIFVLNHTDFSGFSVDKCSKCDVHAKCINGHCKCRTGYIGNGYECVKKGMDPSVFRTGNLLKGIIKE